MGGSTLGRGGGVKETWITLQTMPATHAAKTIHTHTNRPLHGVVCVVVVGAKKTWITESEGAEPEEERFMIKELDERGVSFVGVEEFENGEKIDDPRREFAGVALNRTARFAGPWCP